MGIDERKQREKEEKRELILNTAMHLFVDEGIRNVSIRKIAEKIEYSPATIYLYFKDKGEILHALRNRGFEKLYSLQLTLDSIDNPAEKLKQMGVLYMKFALENRDYYDLMFIAKGVIEKIYEKKTTDAGIKSFQYLMDTVNECIENGCYAKADLWAATFAVWSLVHGMAALIIRGRCTMIPDDVINNIVDGGLRFFFESAEINNPKLK